MIEHNLDVIKQADWVIDLGPEGGEDGGELIAAGTPEDVADVEESSTGQFLRRVLAQPARPRPPELGGRPVLDGCQGLGRSSRYEPLASWTTAM